MTTRKQYIKNVAPERTHTDLLLTLPDEYGIKDHFVVVERPTARNSVWVVVYEEDVRSVVMLTPKKARRLAEALTEAADGCK